MCWASGCGRMVDGGCRRKSGGRATTRAVVVGCAGGRYSASLGALQGTGVRRASREPCGWVLRGRSTQVYCRLGCRVWC
ncbi:unnamed protein product [Prunus armeniaca]|uniref:Uncharacterized protein n=1 Tax=Prunus armeniaca TaxID=36596 RepID=A0A6J5UFS3_PRUAR|nr:unnamed protein product [Prunus armeniaca]